MAFKTFSPGVLTSSDVNTFLMRQAVIVCTSSTRPASPNEGMTIYETDTDLFAFYTGTAWQYIGGSVSYTPTVAGTGWAIGNGTAQGFYAKIGRVVALRIRIQFGSTSTFGASLGVTLSLPFTAATTGAQTLTGRATDASLGEFWRTQGLIGTGGTVVTPYVRSPDTWEAVLLSTRPFSWDTSDVIELSGVYQAAS
jgi:hypothetical protein